jgi:hypothetical protein
MKRVYPILALGFLIMAALKAQSPSAQQASSSATAQPVYLYLYSRLTDHVNMDITEARLRRLLPMIEQFRKQNPNAHVSATIFFSGAVSQALAKRNAQTGIKNFIVKYKKMGAIEIGYDGADEPTYINRPMVQEKSLEEKPYQERWLERATEDEKFLTEGRDPLTGAPEPGTVGGLKAMQKIFGPAAGISDVSVSEKLPPLPHNVPQPPTSATYLASRPEVGSWEVVPVLRRFNSQAILFGLPAKNPAHIPGYNGSIAGIGRMMSPVPDTAPELFWADNVLRFSEAGGGGAKLIYLSDGVEAIKNSLAKMDNSRIQVLHVVLDDENDYLKPDFTKGAVHSPALTYAYAHPDNPRLPEDDRLSAADVNATVAKEAAALKWMVAEYLPASPERSFVSNAELRQMTPSSLGFTVSTDELRTALKQTLGEWGNNTYLPPYFQIGDRYLSLADMFQVTTDALAELSSTGKLPESVRVDRVYGPLGMAMGHGPNIGDVTVASIAKVCAGIAAGLHDDSGYPVPKNVVPPIVKVDGITMNSAQFLRLMVQAMVNPDPQANIRVRMTYMLPATAQIFPKTRGLEDVGATWTFKPAPLTVATSTKVNSGGAPDSESARSAAF